MRICLLALLLLAEQAPAADPCPVLRGQVAAADAATRIAALACQEHIAWYRGFIDRDGRVASSSLMEAENRALADGRGPAWRRVADYWRQSGLLPQMRGFPGALACDAAGGGDTAACRAFVVDQPWSATFVSWVLLQAGLPGFRPSASHIDYVRQAYAQPESSPYAYLDPGQARPAAGDLLCYVRGQDALGYAGLLATVRRDRAGLNMHCEIVVAAGSHGDSTAYLVGGNVQQGVTMRLLPLNRDGAFWNLPKRMAGDAPCSPDDAAACNFNRKDWAVLLQLKPPEALARLPAPRSPLVPAPAQAPRCCVLCVVGAGVPRCPKGQSP